MRIIQTATLDDDGEAYEHFGISRISASLYGKKVSEIVTVELESTEDQVKPTHKEEVAVKRRDDGIYWGWVETNGRCSLIYPTYFQLNMCFSCGIPASEAHGQGTAVRFKAEPVCELPRRK